MRTRPTTASGDTTPVDAERLTCGSLKTTAAISAVPGDTFAYTLSFANVGNQDATGAAISETVPAQQQLRCGRLDGGLELCLTAVAAGTLVYIGRLAVWPAGVAGGATSFAVTGGQSGAGGC